MAIRNQSRNILYEVSQISTVKYAHKIYPDEEENDVEEIPGTRLFMAAIVVWAVAMTMVVVWVVIQ
jgi:hypothetical protein